MALGALRHRAVIPPTSYALYAAVLALILAIVVFLPIPLGNWPPAFALAVLGFAHSQRDGLGVAVGCLIGLLSLAVAGFVVYTALAVVSLVV